MYLTIPIQRRVELQITTDLRVIVAAAQAFQASTGRYPASLKEIGPARNSNSRLIVELENITDPWGRDYNYRLIVGKPHAYCYGKDGIEGGEGPDQDFHYP